MKKVKNEQIANKLVDAIALLKVLKARKQEEIVMIDVFLKDVSDMLKDEKKDEKKEKSPATTSGISSPKKQEKKPSGTEESSGPTAPLRPIAGKTLADRLQELSDAMDGKRDAIEREKMEKMAIEAMKKMREMKGLGSSPIMPGKPVPFEEREMPMPKMAPEPYTPEPHLGGGTGRGADVGVPDLVYCTVCEAYHREGSEDKLDVHGEPMLAPF